MKITEENLKNWFPRDRRFLHYCAKVYGLSFHSKDVVERASHLAVLNVMRLVNRDQEFDNEAHMVGIVMSSFRFAILNSYNNSLNVNEKNLNIRNETELTYGDSQDEYSLYQNAIKYNPPELNNLVDLVREYCEANLPYLERRAVLEVVMGDKTLSELCNETEITSRVVEYAKKRGMTKVRKYYKAINKELDVKKEDPNKKHIGAAYRKFQAESRLERKRKIEGKRDRHSKAMSFIHSPSKV